MRDFNVCLFNKNGGKQKENIELAVKWPTPGSLEGNTEGPGTASSELLLPS